MVFAQAYASGFGMGEDGGGDEVEADAIGGAQDVVHGSEALEDGGVGEHLPAVHVADGVDAGHVGLQILVGGDACGAVADVGGWEVETFDVGLAPGGHQDDVGIDEGSFAFLFVMQA